MGELDNFSWMVHQSQCKEDGLDQERSCLSLMSQTKTERMEKLKEHAWGRVISNVMRHAFSPLSDVVLGLSNLPLLLLPSAGPQATLKLTLGLRRGSQIIWPLERGLVPGFRPKSTFLLKVHGTPPFCPAFLRLTSNQGLYSSYGSMLLVPAI